MRSGRVLFRLFPGWIYTRQLPIRHCLFFRLAAERGCGRTGQVPNASEILQFDAGKLTGASLLMNHGNVISEAEPLDGCEVLAVLMEYEFDLFTAAEWAEYLEANPEADDTETASHYWYVFMGKEYSSVCYILFLNEKLFSKEDAVQMARSIHFTENAF